jgi:Uma2 family endonuclease
MSALTAILEEPLLTEEELVALNSDQRIEIIDGKPVEKSSMGGIQNFVTQNLYALLNPVVRQHKLGYLMLDSLIYLMNMQGKSIKGALIPDLSFIRKASLIPDWDVSQNYPGVPDLAIEVISTGDKFNEVLHKVRRYLERGTEEVWLISPELRLLYQYRHDQMALARIYQNNDSLDASAFFPGVAIAIADLFVLPELG